MIKINEIFYSIQGESTKAGLPCIFIRLTSCNLRCSYCDTVYSFYNGEDFSIPDILTNISRFNCKLVEVTGGEPLLQSETIDLLKALVQNGYTVLLETSGSLPINDVPNEVKIIMDLKTPSSKMVKKNLLSNIKLLKPTDEIKFVIGNQIDYEWSKETILLSHLQGKLEILFSPVMGEIQPIELAEWILKDNLNVRLQLQLHKYIWDPNKRGV